MAAVALPAAPDVFQPSAHAVAADAAALPGNVGPFNSHFVRQERQLFLLNRIIQYVIPTQRPAGTPWVPLPRDIEQLLDVFWTRPAIVAGMGVDHGHGAAMAVNILDDLEMELRAFGEVVRMRIF